MTNALNSHVDFDLRMLRVGGILAGSGMLLASAGTAVICFAVAQAARGWVRQLERSPGAMATDKLNQAKEASNAAMEAWRRSGQPVNGSVSR